MKIIRISTGETVAEITTNHSMTLDEAIAQIGILLYTAVEIDYNDGCDAIIYGKGYDTEDLTTEY